MPRFSDELLDHARYPRNFGLDADADVIGTADKDGAPPVVQLSLRFHGDRISRAAFFANGCGVTIASCSALTELLAHRSLTNSLRLQSGDIADVLRGIPADKLYCADVAIAALRNALHEHLGTDKAQSGVEYEQTYQQIPKASR